MGKYKEQLDRLIMIRDISQKPRIVCESEGQSLAYRMNQVNKEVRLKQLDKQIEEAYRLYVHELIQEELSKLNVDVTLNGDKITDAVIKQLTQGIKK